MYTALLVDDEPWALLGLKNALDWEKYNFSLVLSSNSPHEAFRILKEYTPDVVVSDICMPELTGLELLEYSNKQNLSVEFVFTTGYSKFQFAREALNLGAFAYLLKPVDSEEFTQTMERLITLLQRKQRLRELIGGEPRRLPQTGQYVNKYFLDMVSYVDKHFTDNLTLDFLASQFHLNRTYISDLFKKHTEKSFSQYVQSLRIRYACDLLEMSPMSIQEISHQVGYKDYSNFVRAFKKTMGKTPAKYRSEQ